MIRSEAVDRRRTENTTTLRQSTTNDLQQATQETKIEQHEPH